MNKRIIHLDMDAFFASVEQAVHPEYKGKPLIVGSRPGKYNTVVAACSYEAKASGVTSGMSARQAFRLCPEAVFVPADSSKYIYTSDKILEMIRDMCLRGERASIDEFFLDMSGDNPAQSLEAAMCIKQRIHQRFHITGSIGIAPTRVLAKMAAKAQKPDGLMILEEKDISGFLKDKPVEKVPGIGPALCEQLHLLSVFTCGDLGELSLDFLTGKFGKAGSWLWGIRRCEEPYEIKYWDEPALPPKSVSHSYTLEKEIRTRALLEMWIRLLSEMVGYRLRKDNLEAKGIQLYLRDNDIILSRQKKFYSPTFDSGEIYKRASLILDSFCLSRFKVKALGVCASYLSSAECMYLFEQDKKRYNVISAIDKINDRFGDWSIFPAVLTQEASHRPIS